MELLSLWHEICINIMTGAEGGHNTFNGLKDLR